MGFELVIGFLAHLQTVTTVVIYITIANSHTRLLTTARAKSSQSAVFSPVVAW
jgi:hypothetical protein